MKRLNSSLGGVNFRAVPSFTNGKGKEYSGPPLQDVMGPQTAPNFFFSFLRFPLACDHTLPIFPSLDVDPSLFFLPFLDQASA